MINRPEISEIPVSVHKKTEKWFALFLTCGTILQNCFTAKCKLTMRG